MATQIVLDMARNNMNVTGKCWRKMRQAHCRLLLMMSFTSQRDDGCWIDLSMFDLAWCVSLSLY